MDSAGAVGQCLEHPDRSGTPCTRCGTFRCGECLREGLCPSCRGNIDARPPQPEETVGFGPRAWARIIDLFVGQAAGLAGGVMAGVVLVVLEATGVGRAGWAQRLDHGFAFNFSSGFASSVAGAALTTWACGASAGKWLLGLRVVRSSGERPGLGSGLVRELAYFIDAMFFGLIAKGQMDGSPHRQRLGDQWAKTMVVRAQTLPGGIAPSMLKLAVGVALGLAVQAVVLGLFLIAAAL
jgi:uncharacterized RDD family membrane protein YckC